MNERTCPGCHQPVGNERFCNHCGSAIPQFHTPDLSDLPTPSPTPATHPRDRTDATSAPPSSTNATATPSQPPTPPSGPHCRICDVRPAAAVTFRQGIGKLLTRSIRTIEGPFCRDCGRALGRTTLNATLWTGWWGIAAFFTNFGYAIGNIANLAKLQRLPAQHETSAQSLEPGKPILARSGIWFATALIAAILLTIGALGSAEDTTTTTTSGSSSAAAPTSAPRWRRGACVDVQGDRVGVMRCTGLEDGYVVAVVGSSSMCPGNTDSYVEAGFRVYCLAIY